MKRRRLRRRRGRGGGARREMERKVEGKGKRREDQYIKVPLLLAECGDSKLFTFKIPTMFKGLLPKLMDKSARHYDAGKLCIGMCSLEHI